MIRVARWQVYKHAQDSYALRLLRLDDSMTLQTITTVSVVLNAFYFLPRLPNTEEHYYQVNNDRVG